ETPEGNNQSVSINFSEPLEKSQDFGGLIAIENANNLKFSTEGNILKVYFNNQQPTPEIVHEVEEVPVQAAETAIVVVDSSDVVVDTVAVVVAEPEVDEGVVEAEPIQTMSGELLLEIFEGIESQYGKKM